MSAVLLRDVAARAGVSISAASICLRHGEGFAPATVERVRNAADDLGYGVSAGARGRHTANVAAIVLNEPPQAALACGHTLDILATLTRELTEMGLGVFLLPADQSPEANAPYHSIDADIVFFLSVGQSAHANAAILHARGIPTVHLQSVVAGPVAAIRSSDAEPMQQLAEHVRSLGHERLAIVAPSFGASTSEGLVAGVSWHDAKVLHTRERLRGIALAGIEPMATYESPTSTVEAGRRAGETLLALHPRPTAIMCLTDMLAAGVMVAARDAGLDVPRDLSVTGWDGLELPALSPHRLTTVLQSGAQKGMLLATFAREVLAGGHPRSLHVPQHVSLGTTTGPVPVVAL